MVVTLKEEARKLLSEVPEEYVFRCRDGLILRNMEQLKNALMTMESDVYSFHANSEKNDFANWVKDIIKDDKLANSLQKATGQSQAARLTASRLATFSRRLAHP